MAYGATDAGKNNEVIDAQTRYGADSSSGAGLLLGTDGTEANTSITNPFDTTFLGAIAPSAGVGYMNFKTEQMVAETTFQEAGVIYGGVLDKRYALASYPTGTTIPIGSIALVSVTVTGA